VNARRREFESKVGSQTTSRRAYYLGTAAAPFAARLAIEARSSTIAVDISERTSRADIRAAQWEQTMLREVMWLHAL
jgi:hypothetical protein